MSIENMIKKRLVKRRAWHHNYLDDMVEDALRIKGNQLASAGPREQVKFLIDCGYTSDEIVKSAKRIRKYITKHVKELRGDTGDGHHHSHSR